MSTLDPSFQNVPPPQKRGLSTGAKVAIALLLIFGGLAVLCCGGVAYMAYQVKDMAKTDPAEVAAIKDQIATITLPPNFKAVVATDMKLPFVGRVVTAMYSDESTESLIMLTAMGQIMNQAQMAEMQEKMKAEARAKGPRQGQMNVEQTREKVVQIGGRETTFTIQTGKAGGNERVQVQGTFPGKLGEAVLMVEADRKALSDEQIDQMLESIKE